MKRGYKLFFKDLKQRTMTIKPEYFFFITVLIFGFLSSILTFPLANGDEGYHLSKSYAVFSADNPESMDKQTIRTLEALATIPNETQNFDTVSFQHNKLQDVEQDGVHFHLLREDNSILKIDVAHIPSAIGVLIARFIYPSYGVMLIAGRIANLLFFAISMFFIIKLSKIGKWTLFMLFTVPFIQKMASPSYDVFSYIAIAAFSVNLLSLAKLRTVKQLSLKQIIYTIFTAGLLLLAKNNYIFAIFPLFFLPMFLNPIVDLYQKLDKKMKIFCWLAAIVSALFLFYTLNNIFDLKNFGRIFFHNYFNLATTGRRGQSLFTVVPLIFPDIINLFWLLALFFVMLGEKMFAWDHKFVIGAIAGFFINWIGIYAGFYLILNKPTQPFDELSGRYLHPYIIYFLPFCQYLSAKYDLTISQKAVRFTAIISTFAVFSLYLLLVFYRGYIIHVTPTWAN